MCRSKTQRPPLGKRCPGCKSNPLANIRARIGRYEKKARKANQARDWDRVLHYTDLIDRDVAAYNNLAYDRHDVASDATALSLAPNYTVESTARWTDEELARTYNERADANDLSALEALEAIMDWRDELERARDIAIAQDAAERKRRYDEWNSWEFHHDASPLTNPAVRKHNKQNNPERECRQEYDSYVYIQYLTAEEYCRGNMLTKEGEAKGVDPISLFSGPNSVAAKYASPELKSFFGNHGRVTYTEWRYNMLGRRSDRRAALIARHQDIGEYVQ